MVNRNAVEDGRCPVCGSGGSRSLAPHPDFDGCAILVCGSCTHGFTAPEPTKAELDRYYEEVYGPERRRYFGPDYYEIMRRRAGAQVDLLLEQMARGDLRGVAVCDVGCGVGAAVAECQRRGADALGLDSDAEAVAVGRDLFRADLRTGDLTSSVGDRRFDILLMSHVVEHLGRLRETMEAVLAHLEPGGFLLVEVPATYPALFTERMDTEGHLQFFTQESLGRLVERLGLRTLFLAGCGPHIERLVEEHRAGRASARGRLRRWTRRVAGLVAEPLYTPESFNRYDRDEPEGIWLRCVARRAG